VLLALGISAQKGKNLARFISGPASASCQLSAKRKREAAKITPSPLSLSHSASAEDFHPLEQQRKVGAIVCGVVGKTK
jgi:hypothetical protein